MKSSSTPQAIIVLGAAQFDGRPSPVLKARLDHAVRLHRRWPGAQVITVGGKLPGDRVTEARASADYLAKRGIKARMVAQGNDTRGSLRAANPGVRAVIVTDPLHVARTWLIARQEGLDARAVGAAGAPVRFPQRAWVRALLHESGGLLVAIIHSASPTLAEKVRSALHHVEAAMRPSRKARHDVLRRAAD